jgi:hypothetical protein
MLDDHWATWRIGGCYLFLFHELDQHLEARLPPGSKDHGALAFSALLSVIVFHSFAVHSDSMGSGALLLYMLCLLLFLFLGGRHCICARMGFSLIRPGARVDFHCQLRLFHLPCRHVCTTFIPCAVLLRYLFRCFPNSCFLCLSFL